MNRMHIARCALGLLLLAGSTAASADLNLKTGKSLPDAKPTGDRVYVKVVAAPRTTVAPEILKQIEESAGAWLTARGYTLENSTHRAHAHAQIGFETSRQPHKGGGEEQYLATQIWTYASGEAPLLTDYRELFQSDTTKPFLDDPKLLAQGVEQLLSASVLGKVEKAPAPASSDDPGCWYMMGIVFDPLPMRDKLYFIKGFEKHSFAEALGLKQLDQVTEIDGKAMKDIEMPPRFHKGDQPKVTYVRNYQAKTITVPLTYHCLEDTPPAP